MTNLEKLYEVIGQTFGEKVDPEALINMEFSCQGVNCNSGFWNKETCKKCNCKDFWSQEYKEDK